MASVPNIVCPGCRKTFKGKPELIGKTVRCPGCQKSFTYKPAQEEEMMTVLPASKSADKPAKEPEQETFSFKDEPPQTLAPAEEEEESKAYGVTDVDLAPRCPNCANELESEDAIVCLYCGYNLVTRKWGQTKKTYALSMDDYIKHLLPGILCILAIIGQVIGALYYCLVYPDRSVGTFWAYFDHESTRVWIVVFGLFDMWALGIYAYSRLVVNPMPKEVEKDT